jgi:hypothetical protein
MVITDIYVDMYMLEYTIYLYKYVHIYKLRIAPVDRTTKPHWLWLDIYVYIIWINIFVYYKYIWICELVNIHYVYLCVYIDVYMFNHICIYKYYINMFMSFYIPTHKSIYIYI